MAVLLFADASALAKRYVLEEGSEMVHALFAAGLPRIMTYLTYAETVNLVHRARNRRQISGDDYAIARQRLEQEALLSETTQLLGIEDGAYFDSIALALQHNLNATDGVLLYLLTRYAAVSPDTIVLLCADVRFVRAAEQEELTTLNPERTSPDALPAWLFA
jgi:predicted nucleic acid-binding protein